MTDATSRANRARRLGAACVGLLLLGTTLLAPVAARAQQRSYRLQGLKSGELGPSDLSQGVVIAVVWASWSPRCRDIVERTNAIVDRWGDRALVLLVDFQEEPGAVESFVQGKARAKVYLDRDGSFSKMHAVTNLPGLVIFKDGATGFSGKLPTDPNPLIEQTIG